VAFVSRRRGRGEREGGKKSYAPRISRVPRLATRFICSDAVVQLICRVRRHDMPTTQFNEMVRFNSVLCAAIAESFQHANI